MHNIDSIGPPATECGEDKEGIVEGVIILLAVSLAVVVLLFLLRRPVQRPQPRPIDLATLRRERIEAAQRRCTEMEARSADEETLLFLEEDTEFHREQLKGTREARRQRRKPTHQP